MTRGLFITFEGIDGCGKSTQVKCAEEALRRAGTQVDVSREPGGTRISEKIRRLVMAAEHQEMAPECEVLLYLASRAQHVAERIRPAIDAGKVVLCDRFHDATIAYQGSGRGLDVGLLLSMNAFATGGMEPDLTFVFDVPVDVARKRLEAQNKVPDRLEANEAQFHRRIRDGYLALADAHPCRISVLDGQRPVDELADQVYAAIRRAMP